MTPAIHMTYDALVASYGARRARLDPSTGLHDFTTGELTALAVFFSNAIKEAWERPRGKDWMWPFSILHNSSVTVTSGVIALTDLNYPVWFSLFDYDPRPVTTNASRVPIRSMDDEGIYPETSLGSVFALYIPQAPEFTTTAYSAGATYSKGDVVYSASTGQCYRAKANLSAGIAVTTTASWEEMLIPKNFNDYLCMHAWGQSLAGAGQYETSASMDMRATQDLEKEFMHAFRCGPASGQPWTQGGTWR